MISEASEDGKFIVLENTGFQEAKLGGWRIRRNIDGENRLEYVLNKLNIKVASSVKIWARNKPAIAPRWDLVANVPSWGVGKVVRTMLISPEGEEKALCVLQQV